MLTPEDIAAKREAIRLKKLEEESGIKREDVKKSEESISEIDEQKHEFFAFARVFSGTLRKGQTLFILSPKHNPQDFIGREITSDSSPAEIQNISKHVTKFTIKDIYLMMGRELEQIDEVGPGNIAAIGGLEHFIQKSATLSSTVFCPSFSGMHFQTSPIVQVAIEPKNPSKMKELVKGLKILNQSDPCVEILIKETGEHILCTAGEVHLQRCIDDLVQRFAQIEVNVSPPIIPFRETIIASSKKSEDYVELQSSDKRITIGISAKQIPIHITRFLDDSPAMLKLLSSLNLEKIKINDEHETLNVLFEFKKKLLAKFEEPSDDDFNWKPIFNKIISFGPNQNGPNILVNLMDSDSEIFSVWSNLDSFFDKSLPRIKNSLIKEFAHNLSFGFNLAASKGPLCEEPMQGVAFFLEKLQVNDVEKEEESEEPISDLVQQLNEFEVSNQLEDVDDNISESSSRNENGLKEKPEKQNPRDSIGGEKKTKNLRISSQCVSLTKEACRKAFEAQSPRLMAAMYHCEIMTVNSEALGKLYAVLGKRNAKILDESLKEGTSMFIISANIPVMDSFGFAEEVRKKTSGLASPHLEFSHFEIIDIDPYWEPKTEEELELFGDKADFENQAKKYMNDVRKRKGLFVREKLVEHSEKQRTLIKN